MALQWLTLCRADRKAVLSASANYQAYIQRSVKENTEDTLYVYGGLTPVSLNGKKKKKMKKRLYSGKISDNDLAREGAVVETGGNQGRWRQWLQQGFSRVHDWVHPTALERMHKGKQNRSRGSVP
jgi:hypothetical protein